MTFVSKRGWRAAAFAAAMLALSGPAGAVSFIDLGAMPLNPQLPTPDAVTGTFDAGVSGSLTNVWLDVWAGTSLAGSPYNSVRNGSVTYLFGKVSSALNLVWGSPDSWNTLSFFNGGNLVTSITGSVFAAAFGMTESAADQRFAGLRDITGNGFDGFDSVVLSSTQAAFEFAHVEAVPEIDAASSLGALGALGAMLAFGWERRRGLLA